MANAAYEDEETPRRLGRYELIRRVAVGGMAEIFLARSAGLEGFEKLVVLKKILPQYAAVPEFVAMFLDEARLVAGLSHPNIAQVYDIGLDDSGAYFFAMEFVDGEDVRQILRTSARQGRSALPVDLAIAITMGIAAGLHAAHERRGPDGKLVGIVHRDISPSNVLVTYDGCVKLIDFGIAKSEGRRAVTRTGVLKGKSAYMSPEQTQGSQLDRRSDVFALGILLYEITCGRRPFKGDNEYATMRDIVGRTPEPPTSLVKGYPRGLEEIVLKCLEKDPGKRYQTTLQVQVALERFARDQQLHVTSVALAETMRELFADKLAQPVAAVPGENLQLQRVLRSLTESEREEQLADAAAAAVASLAGGGGAAGPGGAGGASGASARGGAERPASERAGSARASSERGAGERGAGERPSSSSASSSASSSSSSAKDREAKARPVTVTLPGMAADGSAIDAASGASASGPTAAGKGAGASPGWQAPLNLDSVSIHLPRPPSLFSVAEELSDTPTVLIEKRPLEPMVSAKPQRRGGVGRLITMAAGLGLLIVAGAAIAGYRTAPRNLPPASIQSAPPSAVAAPANVPPAEAPSAAAPSQAPAPAAPLAPPTLVPPAPVVEPAPASAAPAVAEAPKPKPKKKRAPKPAVTDEPSATDSEDAPASSGDSEDSTASDREAAARALLHGDADKPKADKADKPEKPAAPAPSDDSAPDSP